ncbi:hypothetical protein PV350_23500 [Streptomyces sp. PA03-6a]|nr:hypothetical protein [Streptomyces sp. PA03-6a]
MSLQTWTNVRLFAGSADLTGYSNKVEVSAEVDPQDATTFGSGGWEESIGGLRSTEINAEGLWDAGTTELPDDAGFGQLGIAYPVSVCPNTPADGDLAYFTSGVRLDYTMGGQVGDIAPWTSSFKGTWPLVRGVSAHPPGTARTATGVGTGLNLGAVPTGSTLYANLHVLAASGTTPTLDVIVRSSPDNTFASPTTVVTFPQFTTTTGSSSMSLAGPITNSWFKVNWTITGTSPSYRFIVTLGIAAAS